MEAKQPQAPLAARLRALGYTPRRTTDEELAKLVVDIDEFHTTYEVKFVEYREEVYDFVKDGMTTRNKYGRKRTRDERCALASDWYDIYDQMI